MAAAQHQVFLVRTADVLHDGVERVDVAAVYARIVLGGERREHEQTVALAVQIPLLAGAEMVHQGMIVLLRDETDVPDAGVDEIRKHEVDDAVPSAERNGGDGAAQNEIAHIGVRFPRKDQTECALIHAFAPPLI